MADLRDILDLPGAVDGANARTERVLREVRTASQALRERLAREFDDGYLELMVVVLSAKEGAFPGQDNLQAVLLENRERRLQSLLDDCKAFDADIFIIVLNRCDFVSGFVEAAVLRAERRQAALGREKTWQKAQAEASPDEEREVALKRAADLGLEMQRSADLADVLRKKQAVSAGVRDAVILLKDEYFKTYDKAIQFVKAYAAARDRVARGAELGDVVYLVESTGSDWAKELLCQETRAAIERASTAFTLLNRRRAPPKPPPKPRIDMTPDKAPSPAPNSGGTTPPAQDAGCGCFVATAVYNDRDHPDVKALRGFRDSVLTKYHPGRMLIAWYCDNGPGAADWLNAHPALKPTVRALLGAVVCGIRNPVLMIAVALAVLMMLMLACRRLMRRASQPKKVMNATAV
jgi:hypothetical protein